MSNILRKSGLSALAVGAIVAVSSSAAQAASIIVEDLLVDGHTQQFDVAGLGQAIFSGNSAADGTSGLGFSVTVTAVEQPGLSKLNTISVLTSGEGAMDIRTSATGFGAGAGAGPSQVKFDVTTSSVGLPSTSGQLLNSVLVAQGYVNNDNVLFGTQGAASTKIGNNLSFSSTGQQVNTAAVSLNNPFSMTQLFTIEHANSFDITSFDATMTATIPLPAGGLLLLTALGGMAVVRRRRKAA